MKQYRVYFKSGLQKEYRLDGDLIENWWFNVQNKECRLHKIKDGITLDFSSVQLIEEVKPLPPLPRL